MHGRVIVINGTSSSGKSTLIKAIRERLSEPFCYYGVDLFACNFHPVSSAPRDYTLYEERRRFMRGFHLSIAAFAQTNNDLIVEHVLETQEFANDLVAVLAPFDTFYVGVSAEPVELERREKARKDRELGTAIHYTKAFSFCRYELEVDTTSGTDDAALRVISAWRNRAIFSLNGP
jgi:chloramphenicol 3-O phosphotransferase